MEKKQSSVEWLEIKLQNLWLKNYLTANTIKSLFEQAKAMHKEEIESAWNSFDGKTFDQYYNETFGGNNE